MSLIGRWRRRGGLRDQFRFAFDPVGTVNRERIGKLEAENEALGRQLAGAVAAIERSHAILADAIARDSWTKGAAINAESILRHALKRAGGQ